MSLYFLTEGEDQQTRLSRDFRSSKVEGNHWDMIISNSTAEREVLLNWETSDLPPALQLVLVDISNNRFLKLTGINAVAEYRFQSHRENLFKVIAGDETFVRGSTEEIKSTLPQQFNLSQNYPNPFNPTTYIDFELPRASQIRLIVYNLLGQQISVLASGFYQTGKYSAEWDGRDDFGNAAATGVYLFRLESEEYVRTVKGVLVK